MTRLTNFFRSMSGRIFLVLIIGVVLSAVTAWGLADLDRRVDLRRLDRERAIDRIEMGVTRWLGSSAAERAAFQPRTTPSAQRGLFLAPTDAAGPADRGFTRALHKRLPGVDSAAYTVDSDLCHPWDDADRPGWKRPCELVVVQDAGQKLRLLVESQPFPPGGPVHFDFYFFVLLIIPVGFVGVIVSRMAAAPLRSLSTAAAELGDNIDRDPVAIRGPSELQEAARTLNSMQARIQRQMAQRTQMLAAITHDLQTPATRLRLKLEKVDDVELRQRLLADLAEMQRLVREGLELARSEDHREASAVVDLQSMVDSIVDDAADSGQPVSVTKRCQLNVTVQPDALRRSISNLIDNALKYGGTAEVSVVSENAEPVVRVRDHGPGVPEEKLEAVFEPFVRLETSRSRRTGGVGLGLTIARSLAEGNGATVTLRNHPQGGSEAEMRFRRPA